MPVPSGASATPFLGEDSILAWEKESTRGTAPSTSSAWKSFGRVSEFQDLGPIWSIYRDAIIGAGQESHEIGREGRVYGPATMTPFQVRDPRVLGFVFSKETNRADEGDGVHYEHTLEPTDAGQLDSMSVGMRDRRLDGSSAEDAVIFLETIMPRLSLRGEKPNPDGSGGRLMAAPDLMAHDHQTTTVGSADPTAVTVSLGSADRYRFHHGRIRIDGEQVFRVNSFELSIDRRAEYAFYWQDANGDKPFEAPPEGAVYDLTMEAVADADTYTVGANPAKTIRELLRDEVTWDGDLRFSRTDDEDQFAFDMTDVVLQEAPGVRRKGKVLLQTRAPLRSLDMRYTDENNSAFFST